jgi:hypothetical protein
VVAVDEATVGAAGKAAAAVTRVERAAERRRDRAHAPPDVQRFTTARDDRDHRRVAAEPPHRLGRECGAVVCFAAAGDAVRERLHVDVDDELRTLAAGERVEAVPQEGLRHRAERVRATRGPVEARPPVGVGIGPGAGGDLDTGHRPWRAPGCIYIQSSTAEPVADQRARRFSASVARFSSVAR